MNEKSSPETTTVEKDVDVLSAFKYAREEERYEVGIVASRLSSLLSSQSLLFTAWAILHGSVIPVPHRGALIGLALAGASICVLSAVAILMAILVIRSWQNHTGEMLETHQPQLRHYSIGRKPLDRFHYWGLEFFSLAVPVVLLVLWMYLLWRVR